MKVGLPPISKSKILSLEELSNILKPLVGTNFTLSSKPRTNGSRMRKLISSYIEPYITNAKIGTFTILPPKKKGVPKILAELIDTYVVTSGNPYNLQVWNRNPNGKSPLVKYDNGSVITPQDIRLILVKVDVEKNIISSIVILTPQYIESHFGKFGRPTIKNQLLVSDLDRNSIVASKDKILYFPDTKKVKKISQDFVDLSNVLSSDCPSNMTLLKLSSIKSIAIEHLVGLHLDAADTKSRGQMLEQIVIDLLGYSPESKLVGGYPDLPNQLLEVKVQDSQTVDLGKYSPQFDEVIVPELEITTQDIRYMIALTNNHTNKIEAIILSSGMHLGERFTYVSDISYKCQKAIPMSFFDKYVGKCVSNP